MTTPSFQQLVAVPMDQYTQMMSVTNMQQPPLQQKMTQLQQDFTASVNAPSLDHQQPSNSYDRLMRQGMMLDEVKRLKERLRSSVSMGSPKPYRSRALALYNQIAPITQFNDQGELIIPDSDDGGDGRAVVGSRVEDLIQHAVRDRRKQFTPTGWSEFLNLLWKYNIPRMMLNRSTIEELQRLTTKTPSATTVPSRLLSSSSSSSPSPLSESVSPPRTRGRLKARISRKRKRSSKLTKTEFLRNFSP